MDIAVNSDGQIATASFDNAVGFWTGTDPQWLDGHEAAVTTVAFLHDGRILSAGDDFTLRLWSSDGASHEVLGHHTAKILDIAVSPDGTEAATASWDGTIGLWDLSGGPNRSLTGHKMGVNAVAFSADGDTLYSASSDGTLRVWNVERGTIQHLLLEHGFGINRLIVNSDQNWLAYGAVDGGTRIVDPDTGELIRDFTLDRRPILAMAFDAHSQQLAIGDGEGYISVISTETLRITRDFRAARQGPIWALAFAPGGASIHAAGIEDILYSWPVDTLTEYDGMAGQERPFLKDPETMPNGERQFKRKCSICHTLTVSSARKAGPTLYQLFGRRAGTVDDYSYSDTLINSDIVWTETTVDALFDQGPDHYIPGSKMPMQVIAKPDDRRDLITYLRRASVAQED
jgi:cytochrome c